MKNLFTFFLASFIIVLSAYDGFSQTSRTVAIYPGGRLAQQGPVPFVAPQHYISIGETSQKGNHRISPMSSNQGLSYFDTSAGNFGDLHFPSIVNLNDGQGGQTPDTLLGYGVHFTSPLTKTYLDSVKILFALGNVATSLPANKNFLSLIVYQADLKSVFYPNNGDTLWFPIPKTPTIGGTRKDSIRISNLSDYASPDPTMPQYVDFENGGTTFKMHHKLVGTDFYVEFTTAFDNANPIFYDPTVGDPNSQNDVYLKSDIFDFSAPYDFTVDRTIGVPKSTDVLQNIPWAGITNTEHPDPGFYSNALMIAYVTDATSGVDDAKLEGNTLAQNFPNPFNPSTEIKYSIANSSDVSLKIYNALGVEVATVVNEHQIAGEHQASFYGDNLPSGTYFYTLKAGTFSQTKRMVLSK